MALTYSFTVVTTAAELNGILYFQPTFQPLHIDQCSPFKA